jgi:AcrR family transcriptional regulator
MNVHSELVERETMADKRTDILGATLKLISDNGFHGTPMSKIADEANVGAGTIYRYFDSKEALINELFLKLKRELSQAMLAGFSEDDTPEEQFRNVWLNIINFCIQHPKEMLFLEQYHNSPFLTPETEAETMQYLAPISIYFQSAIESGLMKELPFDMLSAFTYDVAVALAKRHISGALVLDEANLEIAVQACWDALKAS